MQKLNVYKGDVILGLRSGMKLSDARASRLRVREAVLRDTLKGIESELTLLERNCDHDIDWKAEGLNTCTKCGYMPMDYSSH